MSESDPIAFSPQNAGRFRGAHATGSLRADTQPVTAFNRQELTAILDVYGRKVAAGEWRDYAINLERDKAVFSVFRRASECPLYRIVKCPKLARKQGAFSVLAPAGLILKRGHSLQNVLRVLDDRVRLVPV